MAHTPCLILTCSILLFQAVGQGGSSEAKKTPGDSAPSSVQEHQSTQRSGLATVQYEQVLGTVTRCYNRNAQFNISLKHGLWLSDILYVYRPSADNKLVDKLHVKLVDETQAVGSYENLAPEIDDRVLFLRRKPSTDERINRLVGCSATLSYKNENTGSQARVNRVLILSVRTVGEIEIESLYCVPEEFELRTTLGVLNSNCDFTVSSTSLISVKTGACKLFPDPQTGFLLTEEEWVRRDQVRKKNEQLAKTEAEKKRQEELANAEAEKKRQEELANAEAERKKQEEIAKTETEAERSKQEEIAQADGDDQHKAGAKQEGTHFPYVLTVAILLGIGSVLLYFLPSIVALCRRRHNHSSYHDGIDAMLKVKCPKCSTALSVQRSIRYGEKIKCPECEHIWPHHDNELDERPESQRSRGRGREAMSTNVLGKAGVIALGTALLYFVASAKGPPRTDRRPRPPIPEIQDRYDKFDDETYIGVYLGESTDTPSLSTFTWANYEASMHIIWDGKLTPQKLPIDVFLAIRRKGSSWRYRDDHSVRIACGDDCVDHHSDKYVGEIDGTGCVEVIGTSMTRDDIRKFLATGKPLEVKIGSEDPIPFTGIALKNMSLYVRYLDDIESASTDGIPRVGDWESGR